MPADFFIDAQRGMVFSKAKGVLTWADVVGHMDRLQSHAEFCPEFNQLSDFREVTAIALSHEDVKELAKRTIFSPRSRRAFVVFGDWQFGIGRIFGTYREMEGETGIAIFREMNEALSWLSLAAEPETKLFTRLNSTTAETRCNEPVASVPSREPGC